MGRMHRRRIAESSLVERACRRFHRILSGAVSSYMKRPRSLPIGSLLFAWLLAACSTHVSPAAIAWTDRSPVIGPSADDATCTTSLSSLGLLRIETDESKGCLRVYTDTDQVANGSLSYNNVRRPFDLYASDGRLIQPGTNNQGGRYGEEPVLLPLAPGLYVVASMYGTTYRKVQVEVRAGAATEVPASVLGEASPVFTR